jgi:hypothetical protein
VVLRLSCNKIITCFKTWLLYRHSPGETEEKHEQPGGRAVAHPNCEAGTFRIHLQFVAAAPFYLGIVVFRQRKREGGL